MKKWVAAILTAVLVLGLSACKSIKLPLEKENLKMTFSSGAGGWETNLTLHRDGTFEGEYYDGDMGEMSEDYPNGTRYICTFSGKFNSAKKVNGYTYRLELGEVHTAKNEGDEWIEDDTRYVGAKPYGLAGGEIFYFYLPSTPASALEQEVLSWLPEPSVNFEQPDRTLGYYVLVNDNEKEAFYARTK